MANDDLIAALQRLVEAWDDDEHYELSEADTSTIRTLIADLRAGNLVRREDAAAEERAKVVAFIERYPTNDYAIGLAVRDIAQAIAANAHTGGNDAD